MSKKKEPLLPPPSDFGAPSRYTEWRGTQEEFVANFLDSQYRFNPAVLPTGSGKTLMNITSALATGYLSVYLTATKGLQDQVSDDFHEIGVSDVRGQSNYDCLGMTESEEKMWKLSNRNKYKLKPTVDDGPCHEGKKCDLKDAGCGYYDAVRKARLSEIASTNYSYWFASNTYGEGIGGRELLLCDEAHAVPDELSKFLRIEIDRYEVEALGGYRWPEKKDSMTEWAAWARSFTQKLEQRMAESYEREMKAHERKKLRELITKTKRLGEAQGDWIPEEVERGWAWEPVWPAPYAEQYLFNGAKKIILSSATIRPKTLELLGISPHEYEFKEYASTFPLANRPVYYVPTVRNDRRMTEGHVKVLFSRMDQIIGKRLDRRGLIHSTSFDRARDFYYASKYRKHLVLHERGESARAAIARWLKAGVNAVLVSPSITTGYDFPGDLARYQILMKMPFPPCITPVMKARQKQDPDYPKYLAAIELVQAAGRIVRGPEDWGETFIVDDHATWGIWKHVEFYPKWFLDAVKTVNLIPAPPVLLAS